MKKIVNFCGNCPFSYSDYDDFAVGCSTLNVCTLAQFVKLKDYFISVDNGDEELKTPEWCPLKTDEFTFTFKEFSVERKQEIDSTCKEIEVLQDYFDNTYDVDYDDPEVVEKNNKVQKLYTKLGELQSNEEQNDEDELSKSIDIIKEQLLSLENASIILQESLGKLGE
jgi:hypothetical protein